jgi:hypothetical protein
VISALSVISIFLSYLGVPNAFCIPLSIIIGGTIREERNNLLRQQKQKCEAFLQTLSDLQRHSPTQENKMFTQGLLKLAHTVDQRHQETQEILQKMEQRLLAAIRTGSTAPAQDASERPVEAEQPSSTEEATIRSVEPEEKTPTADEFKKVA